MFRSDVSLVPLQRSHAPAMYRWMLDPALAEALGLRNEPSLERTHAWLDRAAAGGDIAAFAVEVGGRHVGNVVLDQISRPVGSARLSVYIGDASERHSGAGTTAVHLAVRRAFGELQLHKVWLTVHDGNVSAIRCYARVGFRVDGVLRDEFLIAGERRNGLVMSILEPELAPTAAE